MICAEVFSKQSVKEGIFAKGSPRRVALEGFGRGVAVDNEPISASCPRSTPLEAFAAGTGVDNEY